MALAHKAGDFGKKASSLETMPILLIVPLEIMDMITPVVMNI